MTEKWAAIVRVSSLGGRKGDSFHADEDQVREIERYAQLHGAKIELLPPELSVSGGWPIDRRPSLKAGIEGVQAGKYDGIVVAYLSRLSRSRSGIEIWERVEAAGGHVHCAAERLDTSTPNGRFIRDIHLANAVREREEHAEKHHNRRRETVAAGIWRVRQTPRGYEFAGPVGDDGRYRGRARRLVPSADADSVKRAFRDRAAGRALAEIARDLKMTQPGLRALLSNRVYLGELRDGDFVNADAHDALVNESEFAAVQSHRIAAPRRLGAGPALLAGVARCAGCGHRMTRKTAKESLYACRVQHGTASCPAPAAVYERNLDAYVEPILRRVMAQLVAEGVSGGGEAISEARAAVEAAKLELMTLVERSTAANLEQQFIVEALRKRQDAVNAAQAVLDDLLARQPVASRVAQDGAAAYDQLDASGRNRIVEALLGAVVVARAGKGRKVPIGERVRVLSHDSGISLLSTRHGERAAGIAPIALPALDAPGVLSIGGCEAH